MLFFMRIIAETSRKMFCKSKCFHSNRFLSYCPTSDRLSWKMTIRDSNWFWKLGDVESMKHHKWSFFHWFSKEIEKNCFFFKYLLLMKCPFPLEVFLFLLSNFCRHLPYMEVAESRSEVDEQSPSLLVASKDNRVKTRRHLHFSKNNALCVGLCYIVITNFLNHKFTTISNHNFFSSQKTPTSFAK